MSYDTETRACELLRDVWDHLNGIDRDATIRQVDDSKGEAKNLEAIKGDIKIWIETGK